MTTSATLQRRAAIRATLAQRAGDTPDAKSIAAATVVACQEFAAHLAPVIGSRGFDVLFGHALHKTRTAFPWLAMPADGGGARSDTALGSIEMHLAAQPTTGAEEAADALLSTFTELLASLIGESLTERLLSPIWAPLQPAPTGASPS